MSTSRFLGLPLLVTVWLAAPVGAGTPLSAIDWLSDSIAAPRVPDAAGGSVTDSARPEDVTTRELGTVTVDALGLLPASVTGLPADLWRGSNSADIARRLRADRIDIYPAMRDLLYNILLAELDPPPDSDGRAILFLARLDTLLALGALEQADALISQAGSTNPEIFRRAFDVALLLRNEDTACETMAELPALAPTFPARIFCLARNGDWDAAALVLETGRVLGYVNDVEDGLLARFLEPAIAEDLPPLVIPPRPSPLDFRLLEAIGEPMPTAALPRAYAHADLNANTGWKAQIEAAERLVQTGALDANRLLGLYSARRPAASGGVWDRAEAIQVFEQALASGDADAVAATLVTAWQAMQSVELETAFAGLFAERLAGVALDGEARKLALRVGLLSKTPELFTGWTDLGPRERFLTAVARGDAAAMSPATPTEKAIADAFSTAGMPVRLRSLVDAGRMGEAILRAIELFDAGSHGDVAALNDALVFFRSTGFEDVARRAALQLLILDRRG